MDRMGFYSARMENIDFGVYAIAVKKQEEQAEKTGLNQDKSDVDYYNELCGLFPDASFVVEDNSRQNTDQEWLPKRFSGSSNSQNFSYLGTLSIAFDVKIFEKAAREPEFMESIMGQVENLNERWSSMEAQCLRDGMRYMHVNMYLDEDGTIGYTTMEYHKPCNLYSQHKDNLLDWQTENSMKRIMEELERQQHEGLFAVLDKSHENSQETMQKIEEENTPDGRRLEEYEKTFLFV